MALNSLGDEKRTPIAAPVTLPKLAGLDQAPLHDARAETRAIKAGADAWRLIGRVESFGNWTVIGKALAIGREFSLKSSGANAPAGKLYSKTMCAWCRDHGFGDMAASTRSWALELHSNLDAISAWLSSLDDKKRKLLKHPQSIVVRWRAATTHNGKSPTDLKREATAALARFISCMKLLPPEQAAPLWREAQAQAASYLP